MTVEYHAPSQPDILEVIADLSNDEVRTPPSVANAVLDLLPEEVWTNPELRWLDPGAKTGVFLREVTKRLMVGLEAEIPDEKERLTHILQKQVFGIAITELTALMARRTLYCSKDAAGSRSVVAMPTSAGNIWFGRTRHLFAKGRCSICGATEDKFDSETGENYAYAFIHEDGRLRYQEENEMKFDVIVGNPPYQMEGAGGGINDTAIYNKFVEQALDLSPQFVSMIIPSRWMSSGRGLEGFRSNMLGGRRISKLVDYPNAEEVFPSVTNEGGICYFLWERDFAGPASVKLIRDGRVVDESIRALDEFDVLVRDSRHIKILRKVLSRSTSFASEIASADTPFGFASNFAGYHAKKKAKDDVVLVGASKGKRFRAFVSRNTITKNRQHIDSWKILVPLARGGTALPDQVIGRTEQAEPGSVCTQTFRYFGPFDTEIEARNFESFLKTKFARFMVYLRKNSQNTYRETFSWVPLPSLENEWDDQSLYAHFGLDATEIEIIESTIKEME